MFNKSSVLMFFIWQYGTGWFTQHVHDSFRHRVMVRFLSVYPKPGAAKLLKATSEDFEKSKRACIFKDGLKPDQQQQRISKGYNSFSHWFVVDIWWSTFYQLYLCLFIMPFELLKNALKSSKYIKHVHHFVKIMHYILVYVLL